MSNINKYNISSDKLKNNKYYCKNNYKMIN